MKSIQVLLQVTGLAEGTPFCKEKLHCFFSLKKGYVKKGIDNPFCKIILTEVNQWFVTWIFLQMFNIYFKIAACKCTLLEAFRQK